MGIAFVMCNLAGEKRKYEMCFAVQESQEVACIGPCGVRVDTSAPAVHHTRAAAAARWTPLKIHSTHKHARHKFI